MSTWRERMAARAAAAAAAPAKKGVKFLGNATGNTNVAKSPTRKASPHHKNRDATRRALKATARVSPAGSPPQRPGRGAPKFRAAAERATRGKKRSVHKARKSRKAYREHKAKKHTRRHKKY